MNDDAFHIFSNVSSLIFTSADDGLLGSNPLDEIWWTDYTHNIIVSSIDTIKSEPIENSHKHIRDGYHEYGEHDISYSLDLGLLAITHWKFRPRIDIHDFNWTTYFQLTYKGLWLRYLHKINKKRALQYLKIMCENHVR